jgi:predicted NBD/HSP70 family sugar kinase
VLGWGNGFSGARAVIRNGDIGSDGIMSRDSSGERVVGQEGLVHGARHGRGFTVQCYSLALEDEAGMVGDRASQRAFRQILEEWRQRMVGWGIDPFGPTPTEEISKGELDRLAFGHVDDDATRTINRAVDEFSGELAAVVQCFARHPCWAGVEEVIVGGGLKESDVGRRAIDHATRRLEHDGSPLRLRALHRHADEAGLLGWTALRPADLLDSDRAFLAVDLGGTNVRCGIVAPSRTDERSAEIVAGSHWRHADGSVSRDELIERIGGMLSELIAHTADRQIALAPFVGVGCPGVIEPDGSIARGADNLPGDWTHRDFRLHLRLAQHLPKVDGMRPTILLHNDAVVQGLSELPRMRHADAWAILTVGTGLGNAAFGRTTLP